MKEFRAGITATQWQHWLKFARNEKKRMKHDRAHHESPRITDSNSLMSPYDAYNSLNTPMSEASDTFSDDGNVPLKSNLAPRFVNAQPIKVSASTDPAIQPPAHPKRVSLTMDQDPAPAPMAPRSRSTNFNEIPVHEVHPAAPGVEQEEPMQPEEGSEIETDEGLPNRYAMMQSRNSIFHLTRPIGVDSDFERDNDYIPPGASRNPNKSTAPPQPNNFVEPQVTMPPPPPVVNNQHDQTPMRKEERLGRPLSSSTHDIPAVTQVLFQPPSELRKTSPIRDILGNLTQPKLSAYNHHSYNVVPTLMSTAPPSNDAENDGVSLDKRKLSSRRSQSAPRARPTPSSQDPANNNPHVFTSSIISNSMHRSRSPTQTQSSAAMQPTAHSMYRSISPVKLTATPMQALTNSSSNWASPMVARKSPPRARVPFNEEESGHRNHNMLYSMGRSVPLGTSDSPNIDKKSPSRAILSVEQPASSAFPKNKPSNPEQDYVAYRSIKPQPSMSHIPELNSHNTQPSFMNFVPNSQPAEPTAIPNIYESAKVGGKRVDAAYTAAKFLLESFDSLISDNKSQSPQDLEAPK